MKFRFFLLVVMVAVMAFLSACAVPTQTPTPTTAPSLTETTRPSETLAPSPIQTSSPEPTLANTTTIIPTETSTVTPSGTPRPTFAGFAVEYAQPTSYGLLLGFIIPGIKENYRLTVSDAVYTCELNAKAPDRLYCYGPAYAQGQTVKLVFIPLTGDNIPVFETTYKLTLIGTPTLNPTALYEAGKACKIRGVHVTCETEYRNNGDTYCIVSTCVDLCGYYKSIDTCPPGSEHNGIYPMTGTPPLPPNK